LHIMRQPDTIFEYTIADFEVRDYAPQSHISAPVAV
jgi:thymidylate synthase